MAEEKRGFSLNFEDAGEVSATRARNKTMMLSPEVTSRFRSQVLEELDQGQSHEEKTRRINLSKSSFLKPSSSSLDEVNDPHSHTGQHSVKPISHPGKVESDSFAQTETERPIVGTSNFIGAFGEADQARLTQGSNLIHVQEDQRTDLAGAEKTSQSNHGGSPLSYEMPIKGHKAMFEESKEIETSTAKGEVDHLSQEENCTSSMLKLVYPAKKGKLRGFLITYHFNPEGEYFPLYEGRIIVTNKLDSKKDANYLVIQDETVDSFHAIMRVSDGKVMVLDQLSETGTKVVRLDGQELDLNGDKAEVGYREKLRFGNVEFVVLLV